MNCPKCNSEKHKKNGIIKGRQRYKCYVCGYNYTVKRKSTAKPLSTKRQALELYLEGWGFRSIGKFLNVSHVAVHKWVKKYGKNMEELKRHDKISLVAPDEAHAYMANKKSKAVQGWLLIEMGKELSSACLVTEVKCS